MKDGMKVETGGIYVCLYHMKHKVKFRGGDTLHRCDFAGIKCEGNWHLLKEVKEKTQEEIMQKRKDNFQKPKRREFDERFKPKKKGFNKWDFEKW